MKNVFLSVVFLMTSVVLSAQDKSRETYKELDLPTVDLSEFKQTAGGWFKIFDGKSFHGWRGYNQTTVPSNWHIEKGCLHVVKSEKSRERNNILFAHKFSNFELEVEWKAEKSSNSGILYLAREMESLPMHASAPEYQILDSENHSGHPRALKGKGDSHKAGSLYDMIPASPQNAKPYGKWNKARIVCNNGKVLHYQNGVLVVQYELWTDSWKNLLDNSKFKTLKGSYELMLNCGGENKEGFIGLQDHGNEVWFRNIRIREL